MADRIVSAHFQALFDSALQAYKKKTGITLAEHFLTKQLESCSTVEDITAQRRHDVHDGRFLVEGDTVAERTCTSERRGPQE